MLCSVCVATYKRPQLLVDLLESLANQNLPQGVDLEVLVVDNDLGESARSILQKMRDSKRISFRYFSQKEKNIALTRNVAVSRANGEYLLFIDDDEVASKDWVGLMLGALDRYKADGVFGRVKSQFNSDTEVSVMDSYSKWVKKNSRHRKAAPTSGAEAMNTSTANCIVKATVLKVFDGPFDPRYGVSGGSDTHLFSRLKLLGFEFVYCNEAFVTEVVPIERTKVSWLLRRAFRTGNVSNRINIELATTNKIYTIIKLTPRDVLFFLIGITGLIFTFPNKAWRTFWAIKIASNLGKVSASIGVRYMEYR